MRSGAGLCVGDPPAVVTASGMAHAREVPDLFAQGDIDEEVLRHRFVSAAADPARLGGVRSS